MPWFPFQDNLKKHLCRYVLQRYLGQFLEEKLRLDQLTINLYSGTGSLSNISLDVQALNEMGDQQNLPVEFVDGYIDEISVYVPWSNILAESSSIQISGIHLVVQPKQRPDKSASMFESMWSSMSSSIQIAEECLKQTETQESPQTQLHGVESFAHMIDSIFKRVKLRLINTVIRMEHLPKGSDNGVAIEIRIKNFSYHDEASLEMCLESDDDVMTKPMAAFATKNFTIEGVYFYTDEFAAQNRTFSRSFIMMGSQDNQEGNVFNEASVKRNRCVRFGEFSGSQEIKIRIKEKETANGPKIDFDGSVKSVYFFLSPRQLRLVIQVLYGIISPHLQDNSNVISNKYRCHQKPMSTSDYEKVEEALSGRIMDGAPMKNFHQISGWSSGGALEDGDSEDEEFQPLKNANVGSATNSIISSYNSAVSNTNGMAHGRIKSRKESESVGNIEVNNFRVQLESAILVILHEDVTRMEIGELPTEASKQLAIQTAQTYFAHVASACSASREVQNELFSQAASSRHHFRLHCDSARVYVEVRSGLANMGVEGTASLADLEVAECLVNQQDGRLFFDCIPILNFTNERDEFQYETCPNVEVTFKYRENGKSYSSPRMLDFSLNLRECEIEVDLTVTERLDDIWDNLAYLNKFSHSFIENESFQRVVMDSSHKDKKTEWKISCPLMSIIFRFPIVDLSPDSCSRSHLRRSVYDDILCVKLKENRLQSVLTTHQIARNLELQCKSFVVSFKEGNQEESIPFILSGVEDGSSDTDQDGSNGLGFGWPRLVLRIYPKICYDADVEEEDEGSLEEETSQSTILNAGGKKRAAKSPFTSKMVMRESETHHPKTSSQKEEEKVVLAGSKEEIGDFMEDASRNALYQLDIVLPAVVARLPSKYFYEVLYNRLMMDFMLWISKTKDKNKFFRAEDEAQLYATRMFTMCKSAIRTDESEEHKEDENIGGRKGGFKNNSGNRQSKLTVSILATNGVLDILPHARDSTGKVIPGQFGRVQIMLDETNVFVVVNYKGDVDVNYIAVQAIKASLYHNNLIPSGVDVSLKKFGEYPCKYLDPTLFASSKGCDASNRESASLPENMEDMLTVVLRVQCMENSYKSVCVASTFFGATIYHRMKNSYQSWLSQLVDFFDVMDYPIPYYQPTSLVVQFHQQFLKCLLDYRPLHLPIKAALAVESFNISSNMTSKTNSNICTLRFIAEESLLFLSNKRQGEKLQEVDLRRDYVCVLDVSLFDLSLLWSSVPDDTGESGPKVDLRASNNVVRLMTCADSAVALMELVKYVAADGDLELVRSGDAAVSEDGALVDLHEVAGGAEPVMRCDDRLPFLMEEAMVEEELPKKYSKDESSSVEIFFFPDEGNLLSYEGFGGNVDTGDLINLSAELSDAISSIPQAEDDILSDSDSSDFEKDFCFVDQEIVKGLVYGNNKDCPDIRLLTKDEIRLVENHFVVPVEKVDVLKAPKNYPPPLYRYTLREMSIVWHMYGGNDFTEMDKNGKGKADKNEEETSEGKRVTFNFPGNTGYRRGSPSDSMESASFSIGFGSRDESATYMNSPKLNNKKYKDLSWQARGGPGRRHDVQMELELTKMKYQYETYPKFKKHASRQVLAVQQIEIRDKMATSNINKFLYQYYSTAKPKQSHTDMFVIKATNIRSEPMSGNGIEECCLRVSCLPLRLNVDQDSLFFLLNFYARIVKSDKVTQNSPKEGPMYKEETKEEDDDEVVPSVEIQARKVECCHPPIFIRSFVFSPQVPIRLDYEGKHVDMTHGPLAGILMGLGQLNSSELRLKKICNRHGYLGLDKLLSHVFNEWMQDIKKNQLPSLLGGIGPMYSLVQLLQGIIDLFWLPIEQYQKDGRIVRGLQRGANSFTTSTAMAALELTTRIIYAIQRIAETAFDIVSPVPSTQYLRYRERNESCKRRVMRSKYNQPADIREGVATALMLVRDGFGETAQTLVRVASMEHEVKGTVGAVGGVLRQIPSTALTPIILASQATSNVLTGVKSQLVPDARTEAALKWRNDSHIL